MVCVPGSRTPCYSDADCVGNAVCKREILQDNTPGVCFDPYPVAKQVKFVLENTENCRIMQDVFIHVRQMTLKTVNALKLKLSKCVSIIVLRGKI